MVTCWEMADHLALVCDVKLCICHFSMWYSVEFKLTYRYLFKAGHVPSDTWGGANFGSMGIIRTNLVEIHKVVLHTKYQGSKAVRFQTRRFYHVFPI